LKSGFEIEPTVFAQVMNSLSRKQPISYTRNAKKKRLMEINIVMTDIGYVRLDQ